MDRFHAGYKTESKTSRRIHAVWERLTKKQATSRPNCLWPEIWSGMSKAAQRKVKQHWATEKTKLDNARKLRHIDFIIDFKDTVKNARKKLAPSMESATHCNVQKVGHGETSGRKQIQHPGRPQIDRELSFCQRKYQLARLLSSPWEFNCN